MPTQQPFAHPRGVPSSTGLPRGPGQIIFYAADDEVPSGVRFDSIRKVPVYLTLFHPSDRDAGSRPHLLRLRILRITSEAFHQGALLTQEDLGLLLGISPRTVLRHMRALESMGHLVMTRGRYRAIGPGRSLQRKVVESFLDGQTVSHIAHAMRKSVREVEAILHTFVHFWINAERGTIPVFSSSETTVTQRVRKEFHDLLIDRVGKESDQVLARLRSISEDPVP